MVYKDLEVEETEWPVHIRESHEGRFTGPIGGNLICNRILVWCNQILANYYVDNLAMQFKGRNTQTLYDYYKFKSALVDREADSRARKPNVASIIINKEEARKHIQRTPNTVQKSTLNRNYKRQFGKLVAIDTELRVQKPIGPKWLNWIGFGQNDLKLPTQNVYNIAFQYTILTSLTVRIMISLIICLMTDRKLVLSVERDAVSLSQAGCTKKSINNLTRALDTTTTIERTSSIRDDYCAMSDQKIVELFDEEFIGLCLYEVRYNKLGPLMGFFFIELQEPLAFMINEAERLYWVALMIFIMAGYVGRILARKRQFDIPQMLFLLDPKFIAFRVHHSLNYYLTTLRASYINFWSTYKINSAYELTRLDFICPNCDKSNADCNKLQLPCMSNNILEQQTLITSGDLKFDSNTSQQQYLLARSRLARDNLSSSSYEFRAIKRNSPLQTKTFAAYSQQSQVIDCLALNLKNFETYLPEHRNQAWRLTLCRYHPIIYASLFVFIASMIHATTFIMVFVANRVPAHNRELQHILKSTVYEDLPNFAKTLVLADTLEKIGDKNFSNTCQLDPMSNVSIQQRFDNRYTTNDWRDRVSNDFRMKFTRYVYDLMANTRLEYTSRVTNSTTRGSMADILKLNPPYSPESQFVEDVIKFLYPMKSIDYSGIIFGSLTVCAIAVFFAGALTVCALSMLDLCFALTELTIKINVCTIILHHYRDFASNRLRFGGTIKRNGKQNDKFSGDDDDIWYDFEQDPDPDPDPPRQDPFEDKLFNIHIDDLKSYNRSNVRQRQIICQRYADRILELDRAGVTSARASSSKFLVSTYLDYRLFQHEIELSRPIIIYMTFHLFFNSINFVLTFLIGADSQTKYMILLVSVVINNSCIFIPAWFASKCLTLNGIIYSMLAASVKGDKLSRFLMMIWKKTLNELSGSRSKFSFKILSLNLTYAAAIQLDLTIASILIITMGN